MNYVSDDLILYINKLINTVETQATFRIGNIRILEQNRIDDILCCIDVNFPEALKRFHEERGNDVRIRSFKAYKNLIAHIKVKPPFSKSSYLINYKNMMELVKILQGNIISDMKYISRVYPDLIGEV